MMRSEPKEDKNWVLRAEEVWRQGGDWDYVRSVAVLPDGLCAISASFHGMLSLWEVSSGKCLATLASHADSVCAIAISPDGGRAVTAAIDGDVRVWEIPSGRCLGAFRGGAVYTASVVVLRDGEFALLGADDGAIELYELSSGSCDAVLDGHEGSVRSIALLPDGEGAISGSDDNTLKVWDIPSGECLATFEGHTDSVSSVAVLPDGKRAISGSLDSTLKLWEISSGRCLATFEGHQDCVRAVAVLPDGKRAISGSSDGTLRLWHLETGSSVVLASYDNPVLSLAVVPGGKGVVVGVGDDVAFYRLISDKLASSAVEERTRYTNAKVVLVGESGVGKTGLGYRLAEGRWVETSSTHGMQVWPFEVPNLPKDPKTERDVWLWDLAGQPQYRLTHQLFLDETSLALVLCDPSHPEDPFRGIDDWLNALKVAVKGDPKKILVAARTDRGGATVTQDKIRQFLKERGFAGYVSTSALTGEGCAELVRAIAKYIPWGEIAPISTTRLFKALKDAIVRLKEGDIVLIRCEELLRTMRAEMPGEHIQDKDLKTVVRLLAGQGLVKHLDFGDFVLLKPEMLNNYASAVILAARDHTDGIGCIDEDDVLNGKFDFRGIGRLGKEDEEILLRAMLQLFVEQALCIREDGRLVFPSQFNRQMPVIPTHPNVIVAYQFTGPLANIYATLVVKLHYSTPFDKKELWKNAAEFKTQGAKTVGFAMEVIGEGAGRIKVFFDEDVPVDTRVVFIKYIHEHLLKYANNVEREREYVCPKCGEPVKNREVVKERVARGMKDIGCLSCDARIPLMDLIEQKFGQDKFLRQVRELEEQANIQIDTQSRELILVGHMYQIAGQAGQYFEKYDGSRYGLDGEIEFKDDKGKPTGKRIYVQLKSGDSHLRERKRDDSEVFDIHNCEHIEYWQKHEYPVYLVIRAFDSIRWMNITDYLKKREDKSSMQVVFEGEELTESALRRLRDECLSGAGS